MSILTEEDIWVRLKALQIVGSQFVCQRNIGLMEVLFCIPDTGPLKNIPFEFLDPRVGKHPAEMQFTILIAPEFILEVSEFCFDQAEEAFDSFTPSPDSPIELRREFPKPRRHLRAKLGSWYLIIEPRDGEQVEYAVIATTGMVTVLFFENRERQALLARRALIEACVRTAENSGSVVIHGSALAHEGRAILVIGPKGARKSTFALLSCLKQFTSLVSDHRVLLRTSADQIKVSPHPLFSRIDTGILARLMGDEHVDTRLTIRFGKAQLTAQDLLDRGISIQSDEAELVGLVSLSSEFRPPFTDRAKAKDVSAILEDSVRTPFENHSAKPWIFPHLHDPEWFFDNSSEIVSRCLRLPRHDFVLPDIDSTVSAIELTYRSLLMRED